MSMLECKASDSVSACVGDSETRTQSSRNDKADALGRVLTV